MVWTLYLALEPYVRRRWPQSMISWSRVLSGGIRDPLVGGHLLFGLAFGVGYALLTLSRTPALEHYGAISYDLDLLSILGMRGLMSSLFGELVNTLLNAMGYTFILMVLRVLLRRQWLAAAAFVMLLGPLAGFAGPQPRVALVYYILSFALFAAILLFFGGLLTIIVCGFVTAILGSLPLTMDFSAWYSSTTLFAVVVVLALTAYAFHTAVAGRPLFKAGFLDAD